MRQFWGQQQRFFKEMASASKVQFVVEQAKAALESGMSVVVGLQSTGESGMDKVRRKATSAFFSVLYWCSCKYPGNKRRSHHFGERGGKMKNTPPQTFQDIDQHPLFQTCLRWLGPHAPTFPVFLSHLFLLAWPPSRHCRRCSR